MDSNEYAIVQSESIVFIGKADLQKANDILDANRFVVGFDEGEEIICLSSKHKFGLSLDIVVRNGHDSGYSAYVELSAYDPDGLLMSSVDLLGENHLASDYLFSVSYGDFEVNLRSIMREGNEL